MAVVDGLHKQRMLEIEAQSVVGGVVDDDDLVLTRHDGSSFIAGNVRGPRGAKGDAGNAVDLSRPWSRTTTYAVNDVVGYAGRMWKAKTSNLDKPPYFNTNAWAAVTGHDESEWFERDPNFFGTNLGEAVEIYWGEGTRTSALTKVSGEFESFQALKMTLGSNSNSWIYAHEENVVRGGEKIRIRVRAKLLADAPGTRLRGLVSQNTPENMPAPFITGHVSAEDPGMFPQLLTTDWETYTFVITALPDKPRARSLVIVETGANSANVVVDYIRVDRLPDVIAPVVKTYVDSAVATVTAQTELGTGVNLNTITTPGVYYQSSNVEAAAGTNYPVPYAGLLEVFKVPNFAMGMCWQRYTLYLDYGPQVWSRRYYDGQWSAWYPDVRDTGWVTFTGFQNGFSNATSQPIPMAYRLIGKTVYLRGRIQSPNMSPNKTYVITDAIPALIRPPSGSNNMNAVATTGGFLGWSNVDPNGTLGVHFKSPWVAASGVIELTGVKYLID